MDLMVAGLVERHRPIQIVEVMCCLDMWEVQPSNR